MLSVETSFICIFYFLFFSFTVSYFFSAQYIMFLYQNGIDRYKYLYINIDSSLSSYVSKNYNKYLY